MPYIRSGIVVAGLLVILVTLLPMTPSDQWWIRVFDFPRLQIAAGALLVAGAFLFFYDVGRIWHHLFLAGVLIAFGYQAVRIFSYTPLASKQVVDAEDCEPSAAVRLLVVNVLMENRRAGDLLEIVGEVEPDVILVLEGDDWWDRQLSALDRDFPFAVRKPLDNTYGMHLFSKLELEQPEVRFLVEDEVPSLHTRVRLRSGASVDFYGVHPRPPKPGQDTEERDAELVMVGKQAKERGRPAIVAGDLNDVAWSSTTRLFQRVSGLLDPRIGRGMYSTFNANWRLLRWPLDHVFHDESFTLRELRRLGHFGSDHFPVLADLCYDFQGGAAQEAPAPEPGDEAEAQETIREGMEAEREE